jgi:hypothetical protein
MAYSDFTTLSKTQESFGLELQELLNLFETISPVVPSAHLQTTLAENFPLATAINTEKARSELLIAPILLEVRRQMQGQIGFFSGTEFNVNKVTGLTGYCDYILTASQISYEIQAPVVTLTEAKNENIKGGLGQCAAEMVAAQEFNRTHQSPIEVIYGAVTTGTDWKFLKLVDQVLWIDRRNYFINEVNQILGILVNPFRSINGKS